MEIRKVYKTSKGLFWSKVEAEKNREKELPESSYEPVREAYVLFTWEDQDYLIYGPMFELNPVEVK